MEENLQTPASRLIDALKQKKLRVAAAEAATNGMLSQALSAEDGASEVFRCGVIVLDNDGMNRLAGVSNAVCRKYGVHSKEAAIAMAEGIRRMGRRLKGFDDPDALLTAPETRSSSPVRILRNETRECPTVRGLFPCGEGAGYAGGITSAAVDGLRCAEEILKQSL